jgi:succinate-acetate transporter protein
MERDIDETSQTLIGGNPLPLGFAALGLTTALFGAFNAGHTQAGGLAFAGMALFVGGLVQLVAGILAYRNRGTFGLTLFGALGGFWLGMGALFLFNALGTAHSSLLTGQGSTWFWFFWAIFGTYLWLASLRVNGAVTLLTLLMAAMFWALWIGALTGAAAGVGWTAIGGWLGWAAALVAGYTSFAELINFTFGKVILPEFPTSQTRTVTR